MIYPKPFDRPFQSDQEKLFREFGFASDGCDRQAVIGAAGNLILNTLRQSNKTLGDACEELDDLVARMKKVLAEHHYSGDGSRQNQNIIMPPPDKLFPAVKWLG